MSPSTKRPITSERSISAERKHWNWKLPVKLAVTALALYWVFRKIDLGQVGYYLMKAPLLITLLAILAYNVAKVFGSYRLNLFFRVEDIVLSELANLRLYYKGMFYNLFLPGGVGGDAYKGYLIHDALGTPVKKVVRSILWDRVSGVAAIVFLSLLIAAFYPEILGPTSWILAVAGSAILYPAFWIATILIVPIYRRIFLSSTATALLIQILQGVVTLLILIGMDVRPADLGNYLFVYFISTLATTLPVTIGAIGIREVVFIKAADLGLVDQNTAIAFSILFFAVGAVSSLPGAFIKVQIKRTGADDIST